MKLLPAFLAMLVVIAPPAIAQFRTQSGPSYSSTHYESASIGSRFGACLANARPDEADALLRTEPGSAAETAAYEALIPFRENRCVQIGASNIGGQQLHVAVPLLRGYLAEERYLQLYGDGAPASIAQAQPGEIDQQILFYRLARAQDRPAEMVRIFSDCVVAARPMAVDALIRTGVESEEQTEAFGRLASAFGPCVWEGQTIEFSPDMLRAALADALYRRSEGRTVMALAEEHATE